MANESDTDEAVQDDAVIRHRIEQLQDIKSRSTREVRIKEARKLGYSVVVHSATGVFGSSR